MVTRDGQPKATLEGCLVIANITNSTISASQLVNQKTFTKTCKGRSKLSAKQSKATRALVNTSLFVTVDLS